MSEFEGFTKIGFTQKAHGLDGELKIAVEDELLEDFLQAKVLFLKIKGHLMPYFLKEVRGGQFLILKLEEINDRNKADELSHKEIFLRDEDISEATEEEDEALDLPDLEGFTIDDLQIGIVGKIEEIQEFPQQIMALVIHQGKEKLIPLHEHFIKEILPDRQLILMNLPDGILDL